MNILVLGSNGMAGHVITKYLINKGYRVSTLAKSNSDFDTNIENTDIVLSLKPILENFDFVINCIGLLVKDSIERPDRAIVINSWFSHALESMLNKSKTKIIHLSTDCVFSGSRGYYLEDDYHDEKNWYGRSKSMGEINNQKDITFRMSIIGPELKSNGTGLFHFVCNNPEKEIQGWTDAFWNGMTTLQLAKCIEQYINNPTHAGVYHLVNNNVYTDKYSLVSLINEIFDCNNKIKRVEGPKRVNKILINSTTIKYNIPNYETQLAELKTFYLK